MVIKTQVCHLSGRKVYPGRGILFIRSDGQHVMFSNSKSRRLYTNGKRPIKIAWTAECRKSRKKDQINISTLKKKKNKTYITKTS